MASIGIDLQPVKEEQQLIAQLKSRIFELEQSERDYLALQSSHTNLQLELSKANEVALKTEYEMKQKTELQSKQITDLSSENESFQKILNDKIIVNKKLYADNQLLLSQSDALGRDYENLSERHSEVELKLELVEKERDWLYDIKSKQEIEIQKLFEDNRKLNGIWKEQEGALKQFEQVKIQLVSKIEEMEYELSNLKGKVKSKEENLVFVKSQMNETKAMLTATSSKLTSIEKDNETLKRDIGLLQVIVSKEKEKQGDVCRLNEELRIQAEESKRELEKSLCELEKEKQNNGKADKENARKIKEECNIVSQENEGLRSVIENVLIQDNKMRSLLKRRDKIASLIEKNKRNIENSLNTL